MTQTIIFVAFSAQVANTRCQTCLFISPSRSKSTLRTKSRIPEVILWLLKKPFSPLPFSAQLVSAVPAEAGRGSHLGLSTLNGALSWMDLRVQGPPGVGSGWSGVSGLVLRPLITSSVRGRWGCAAFQCRRKCWCCCFFGHMKHSL